MFESKHELRDIIKAITIELECVACGFIDFVAANSINGEVFLDTNFKCEACGKGDSNTREVLKKERYDN